MQTSERVKRQGGTQGVAGRRAEVLRQNRFGQGLRVAELTAECNACSALAS